MTASTEAHAAGSGPDTPLDGAWRRAAAEAQRAAMPDGATLATCMARLGSGGLGRHLGEILDALAAGGEPARSVSGTTRGSESPSHALGVPYLSRLLRAAPWLPTADGVRTRAAMVEFDAYAAERVSGGEHLIAFNCQALTQLRAAGIVGCETTSLVAANPHLRRLARQHAIAHRRYPFEGSWAARLKDRALAEYAAADRILVSSSYTRDSFLAEGFPEERLVEFPLTPDPRYEPAPRPAQGDRFEIVYIGSLAVHKGVPLLIDAVRRLPGEDISLRLVGGWGTPGMRRFLEKACAEDRRIVLSPGDPLPHLRAASLCVHPAYEDGFAYAPAEALAAGVPVIVSEDTGMKDLIRAGRDGAIVPTGDLDALIGAIEAAHRGELLRAPGGRGDD
jgi:glycosyltransferase involved in cell wall biosynthesis